MFFILKGEKKWVYFCRNFSIALRFYRLLAPTLSLCMVCESACLLVYVTKKMYLHNKWTLEDFKKKIEKNYNKKKSKQTKTLPRAPDRTCFFLLWCANKLEKDFVQTTPLRNIWYCFYWILFPISDFNMIQHLRHHVWTVLKRNVLCQASATFTHLQDKKTKQNTQKTFPKNVPLSKTFWASQKQDRFWFGKKGHRRFDCHTHLGQFYIWYIYIKPLWLKSSSRFTCKWI